MAKGDYLDLTDLQKRGILRKGIEDNKEYADFSVASSLQTAPAYQQPSSSTNENPLSFLDSFAASAANSTNAEATAAPKVSEDASALAIKIENIEYQLERLVERLAEIEKRLR